MVKKRRTDTGKQPAEKLKQRINRNEIKKGINRLAEEVQDILGISVVRTEFVKECGRRILRIIINKEGGVSLSDCEDFSRMLGDRLDEEDIIKERYYLEVASPGISLDSAQEKQSLGGQKPSATGKRALKEETQ